MKSRVLPQLLAVALALVLSGCDGNDGAPPTPTPPPSPTANLSPTPPPPTSTPTATVTATATPVPLCGNSLREGDEECDDGNNTGGDGCAVNCTPETARPFNFDLTTNLTLDTPAFNIVLGPVSGRETWRTGKARAADKGAIPVAVRLDDVEFDPLPVSGLVCICLRGAVLAGASSNLAAAGQIGCGSAGLVGVNIDLVVDHNIGVVGEDGFSEADCRAAGGTLDTNPAHPGVCNGPPVLVQSGQGPPGSILLERGQRIGQIADGGSCAVEVVTKVCSGGGNPGTVCTLTASACTGGGECVAAKGPDGVPCNADDPPVVHGEATHLLTTTGSATASILDADNTSGVVIGPGQDCGGVSCPASASGMPADCEALAANPEGGLSGVGLASEVAELDTASGGDRAVSYRFDAEYVAAPRAPANA